MAIDYDRPCAIEGDGRTLSEFFEWEIDSAWNVQPQVVARRKDLDQLRALLEEELYLGSLDSPTHASSPLVPVCASYGSCPTTTEARRSTDCTVSQTASSASQ